MTYECVCESWWVAFGEFEVAKECVLFSSLFKISFVKQFESSSVGFKLVQAEAWKFQPGQQVQVCILKNRLGVSKILNVKIPKYKTNKIDLKITKKNIKL